MPNVSPSRIRSLRHGRGWTQAELAAAANLATLTVTAYEAGKTTPSASALGRLAEALGCPVDAFYDQGHDERGEYWAAACAALPPLSDETCRAVGLIFRSIDAARAARESDDGGRPDAA
jgi:transcriptional regulator with XRE-family HTH domain